VRRDTDVILPSASRAEAIYDRRWMSETCVVHLVWGPLGRAPLERFAASYRHHPAGAQHRLVLLLNGVEDPGLLARCQDLAGELGGSCVSLSGRHLDLEAYVAAAGHVEADTLCFLNSHSRPLVDGWLVYLLDALSRPGVGLVGATGSWGSQLDYLRYQLRLPSAYAAVYGDREATRQEMLSLSRQADPSIRDRGRTAAQLGTMLMLLRQSRSFTRFPSPHVRTNAFVISRDLLLEVWPSRVPNKLAAYRLENGRHSLTARVAEKGRRAVLVGRDGLVYPVEDWPYSLTFWQGTQENLLVADNRTEDYRLGDAARRLLLSRYAWAEQADPGPRAMAGDRHPARA
jgi:hypothetical protein